MVRRIARQRQDCAGVGIGAVTATELERIAVLFAADVALFIEKN
jgi:hypothetical protein